LTSSGRSKLNYCNAPAVDLTRLSGTEGAVKFPTNAWNGRQSPLPDRPRIRRAVMSTFIVGRRQGFGTYFDQLMWPH
jgi:hypothetical protein